MSNPGPPTHRSIVFAVQSERVGFDCSTDLHTIVCVELRGKTLTSNTFKAYIFSRRLNPREISKMTGSPSKACADLCWFDDVVDEFLLLITGANLIFHDAKNCIFTINAELGRLNRPSLNGINFIDTCDLVDEFVGEPTHLAWFAEQCGISIPLSDDPITADAQLNAEIYLKIIGNQ
jgi:DNA polymerase III epsilon subunit-like protein